MCELFKTAPKGFMRIQIFLSALLISAFAYAQNESDVNLPKTNSSDKSEAACLNCPTTDSKVYRGGRFGEPESRCSAQKKCTDLVAQILAGSSSAESASKPDQK